MNSPQSDAPQWFLNAINTPYETRNVDVEGCNIEYYSWGDSAKPGLILVHGSGGHANWWDFIAPFLIDDYHVCAPHLSGMGNSDYRDSYSFDTYAKEIIAVAQDAGMGSDIRIIGHSLGGILTIHTAKLYSACVKGIIVVDSPLVPFLSEAQEQANPPKKGRSKCYYPDRETALSRFRLVPPQDCDNLYLIDHIARTSIREFDQGWSWKFDAGIHSPIRTEGKDPVDPNGLKCLFGYIYGEESVLVPPRVLPELRKKLKDLGPVVGIPHGHHHLMLDEPLALTASFRAILTSWRSHQIS